MALPLTRGSMKRSKKRFPRAPHSSSAISAELERVRAMLRATLRIGG